MANTFQEDLGQLIERHRSEFKEPCNPHEVARQIVSVLKHADYMFERSPS